MMIEQPLGWDDLYATWNCRRNCRRRFAWTNAFIRWSMRKQRSHWEPARSSTSRWGGWVDTRSRSRFMTSASKGIPVWCGGMLEAGIGRAHNIALSTLPNFILPGDVTASRRYWHEDIIEPEVTVSAQGTIRVPTGPGIGFAPRMDRIEKLTVRKERLA